MPIKPENRALYPADWPTISLAVKERAGWRCMHPGWARRGPAGPGAARQGKARLQPQEHS